MHESMKENFAEKHSPSDPAHYHYNIASVRKTFALNGTKDLTYTVAFTPGSNLIMARLDYITVNYQRYLDMSGKSSLAFSLRENQGIQYELR